MQQLNLLLAVQSDELARGGAIAATGLLIVFVALLMISLFIALLPRILQGVANVWPEVDEPQTSEGHPESLVADDAHVLAAIGFVLHTELQRRLAAEKASTQPKD